MSARRLPASFLAILLGACSGPIGVYHNIEGGAIAQTRQPPPGADQPYPNLADVPSAPPAAPAITAASINARATGPSVTPPNPAALAGLSLPTAPPPLPDVPGLNLPATPSTPAPPPPAPVAAPTPSSAPIAIAFPANSAILPPDQAAALAAIAANRGAATILAGGFGDNVSLPLALSRAQRLASALTAAGAPASAITLTAARNGSGGFVQLVY